MQEFETPLTLGSSSNVVSDNDIWGSTQGQQQTLKVKKKTLKNKPTKPQNNLRQLRAFSTVVCLSVESETADHSGKEKHCTWRHHLPYSASPYLAIESQASHGITNSVLKLFWFGFCFFFPQSKENPGSWAASCFKQFIQRKANDVTWDRAFLAVIT